MRCTMYADALHEPTMLGLHQTINAAAMWGHPPGTLFIRQIDATRVFVRDAVGGTCIRFRVEIMVGDVPSIQVYGVYKAADWSAIARAVPC